jgi:tmRNA-binding protein
VILLKKHHTKAANEVANNRKARHDYNILETYEAGIS